MPDLADEIEADLNWREAELASLKRQVRVCPAGSVERSALLRALSALLYAHYEGFCKNTWDRYIDAVNKSGVKRKECKKELAILSLSENIKGLRSAPEEELWDFCENRFGALLNQDFTCDLKFKTSNLTPALLRQYCKMALLPHAALDAEEVHIKIMIGRRHEIAHGKKQIIRDISDYLKYESAAFNVMYELGIAVYESVEKKRYLK